MNTDKLSEIVGKILRVESQVATQSCFQELDGALNNLVNQPQNAEHQRAVSEKLTALRQSLEEFVSEFTPQDYERVLEISFDTFDQELADEISRKIQENAMTPSVAREFVQKLSSDRTQTFQQLNQFASNLKFFGFGYPTPTEGTTEVGFQIPRAIFENEFESMLGELKDIRNMVRFFSVTATGQYQKASVGSISTTDPLFFLIMAKEIALMFGGVVTWGIGVWYSVEQIRKTRAETAQIEAFTPKEIEEFFDKKIEKTIKLEVEKKVASLLKEGKATKAQQGELKGQLTWALNSLLAKMERGLTIELRIAPPSETEEDDADETVDESEDEIYDQLLETQNQLIFPEPSDDPILGIPKLKDDEG
ncbi:hypothetical protein [Epibacterium ulvae]|uniref:hypothetical protein n=1 Tax=Epibacterium ulvae TaxID=1156985 RepID=UPI002492A4B3|nr:hypothetical protein [Epibacterium ulvae]